MRWLSIWMVLFLPILSVGQNLVPNPSFEEADPCLGLAGHPGWVTHWFVPPNGWTPDYWSDCSLGPGASVPNNGFGFQEAVSGGSYLGFYAFSKNGPNGREALSVELNSDLVYGEQYVFRAYFSLAEVSEYHVRSIGFLVGEHPLTVADTIVQVSPTYFNEDSVLYDMDSWVLLEDTFIAFGGERFLTIANFLPDLLSDTVYVGGAMHGGHAYYYVDDVWLSHVDSAGYVSVGEELPWSFDVELYPNPNTGEFSIQINPSINQTELVVWDISGKLVWSEELRGGKNSIQTGLKSGLYLYGLLVNGELKKSGKISVIE